MRTKTTRKAEGAIITGNDDDSSERRSGMLDVCFLFVTHLQKTAMLKEADRLASRIICLIIKPLQYASVVSFTPVP